MTGRGLKSPWHDSAGGEVPGPIYEFYCRACKEPFAQILRLVDYEEGDVVCPHCGSREVEQRWSAICVRASRKSA